MMRAMVVLALLAVAGPVRAQEVTVRALASDYDFTGDDALEVEITVDGAVGLTGLEFSIVFPGDALAVDQAATHELGTGFSHAYVNYDADTSGLPAGSRRIAVAFAVAQPLSREIGTLLTVSFPLRCSDFGGGWPDGRPVTIDLQDEAAWKAAGSGLPALVTSAAEDRTVTVDCTSVAQDPTGFSALKARHTSREGVR
jgi:hypothetical protein